MLPGHSFASQRRRLTLRSGTEFRKAPNGGDEDVETLRVESFATSSETLAGEFRRVVVEMTCPVVCDNVIITGPRCPYTHP